MVRMTVTRLVVATSLLLSAAVSAHEAYTTRLTIVRAGPDRDYPQVAQLAPGTPVEVAGCLSDFLWCDVVFRGNRGWVYAKFLHYPYQNRRVPIYGYGAAIGLPIVAFSIFSYWDNHYRGRPFYHDRPRWENWPYRGTPAIVPPHRAPAPAYRPPRPVAPYYGAPHPVETPHRAQRPVEPNYRPPRPVEPQYRPPRPVEPQYRPPRPVEPQFRPPRPVEPQFRPPRHDPPRAEPPARPPGPREGSRREPGGERRMER